MNTKKFMQALNSNKPIKELLSIAEEEYFLGKDKSAIIEKFDQLCDSLKDENKIDVVLEAMDIIEGWCSPDKDIHINKATLSEQDYIFALNNIKDNINTRTRKMLKAHFQHKKRTHSDLAQYAGASNRVNVEYGKIGHFICKELHFPAIVEKKQGKPIWRSVFIKKEDNMLVLDNQFHKAIKKLDWILNECLH